MAASNAKDYDMVKPWCTATIQYLVGNPRGFDQLELLDCLVQNAHFDYCELWKLPWLCIAINKLAADWELVCLSAAVQAASQAQVQTKH